ncbi:hypothetical protein MTR_7g093730 [Medicago truncatula]|uniref:Uncharacterized protein n=1 Tax=Medicago truncatula TaxID=3880 RepID=G7KWB6_MEDTR|nr:hypothetical protein MTR_7g093730 [Medicago truncatula]
MSDRFDDDVVEAMKELISLWVINPSRQVSHRKTLVQSFGPICFVACSAETATKAQTKASIKAGPRLYLFITRDIKYMVVFIYKKWLRYQKLKEHGMIDFTINQGWDTNKSAQELDE